LLTHLQDHVAKVDRADPIAQATAVRLIETPYCIDAIGPIHQHTVKTAVDSM
jgi:hypothetical protein